MAESFIIGDYTYTPALNRVRWNFTNMGAGRQENVSISNVPYYSDRYGEGDAWARWIYIDVFDEDEGSGAVQYGVASSGYVRHVYYSYNGSNTLTLRNDSGDDADIDVYYDFLPAAKSAYCRATDKTKSAYGSIPSSVIDPISGEALSVALLSSCFANCTSLVTAPTIPNTVTTMNLCFTNCKALESAPDIPSSVTDMRGCFKGCTSLSGNISVNNVIDLTDLSGAFESTVNQIFIVNGGSASESAWKSAASSYSNVHYQADDNPRPVIADFTVTRVAAAGSTEPAEKGTWAYITATLTVYETLIPAGWTNELKTRTLQEDDTTITPTWFPSTISSYPVAVECWVNTGDTSSRYFTLQIADSVKNENNEEVQSTQSYRASFSLPKSYALVDYYHDPTTGTEGFAIGKFAESADLFDVDMETIIRDKAHFAGIVTQIDEPYIGLDAWYGYSDEAADTAIKVVDTFSQDWEKTNGAYLVAIFEHATSVDTSLNVDGTGATAAYYNGSRLGASNGAWAAGDVVIFEYSSARYNRIDYSDSLPVDVRLTYHILSLGWGGDVFGPILVPVSPQTA